MKNLRRGAQYIVGLAVMALGIVFIKKAGLGMSCLSAVPSALANLLPFTLGAMTAAFHAFCVLLMILITGKIELRTVLTLPLAAVFGWIIDLLMYLLALDISSLAARCGLCLAGIVFTSLGIVMINGADLMHPAPDALLRAASKRFDRSFAAVKVVGDVVWVSLTAAMELIFAGRVMSVGAGTLASMLLTGFLAGIIKRCLPFLELPALGKKDAPESPISGKRC